MEWAACSSRNGETRTAILMNIPTALCLSLLWAFPVSLILTALLMLCSRGFRLWTTELVERASASLVTPIIVVAIFLAVVFASGLITGAAMGVRL